MFDELYDKNIELAEKHEVGFQCVKFIFVKDELWCIDLQTQYINIVSTDGVKLRTVATIEGCGAVKPMLDGVVIASANGLFFSPTPEVTKPNLVLVAAGDFDDVTVRENKLYGLESKGRVQVITYCTSGHKFHSDMIINLTNYSGSSWNSIEVTEQHIYVCTSFAHQIHQYTIHGGPLMVHNKGSCVGELRYPFLSGCDANGDVMIAEYKNHRLNIIKGDGTWRGLALKGLGQYPCGARFHDGRLYVMLVDPKTLQIFKLV